MELEPFSYYFVITKTRNMRGIGVAAPKCTNQKQQVSMIQQYQYSTRWVDNIVVILHIYGARAIYLLFRVHQDTSLEQ